jgi:hypothetical protein
VRLEEVAALDLRRGFEEGIAEHALSIGVINGARGMVTSQAASFSAGISSGSRLSFMPSSS